MPIPGTSIPDPADRADQMEAAPIQNLLMKQMDLDPLIEPFLVLQAVSISPNKSLGEIGSAAVDELGRDLGQIGCPISEVAVREIEQAAQLQPISVAADQQIVELEIPHDIDGPVEAVE